ncbi:MAG TPA: IS1182 family transposase, partial [Candidatus Saccharimonadia bacterium]|nr:IS1182 family transposase [Candidatus Saccharimonadia bacterium]
AAFPKGHPYLTFRDALGIIFQDEDFAALFPMWGQPGLPPWRLAFVTIMQFRENLADRQAAEAVRARIDWKYLLSLELTDPGFDFSVLSEFRDRLLAGRAEELLLDKLLERCRALGLLTAREQRTDSTHVLAAIRVLNRLELVAETLRAALNAVATVAPDWLQAITPLAWYERYSRRIEESRLPKDTAEREAYAHTVGEDGFRLLDLLETPEAPAGLRELPRMEALRRTWQRHYERTAREPAAPGAPPERRVRFKASRELPPAAEGIESPYDVEARYRHKRDTAWTGYMVHVSETCEPTAPHLLTHVHTTPATVHEAQCTELIQQALIEKDVPPREHLVDAAYISSELLVRSRDEQDIILRGPTRPSQGWQTQVEGVYSVEQFVVDWEQQQVRCPQGQVSAKWWEHGGGQGSRPIIVEFATQTCAPCPVRAACTRAKRRGRRLGLPPRAEAEAVADARTWYASAEGKAQYGQRAGIEGTLSQGVRAFGLRRTRYWGLAKTHLQHVAIAAAINIDRSVAWLDERPRAMTRISRFAALAPANADNPGEAAA